MIADDGSLVAQSIVHKFGNVLALDDVSLKIGQNELVSLIGPSGCGKTTLLNMFAGFLQPTVGACFDRNGLIQAPSKSRTVIFQDYALFPWMSVRQNVAVGLQAKGLEPTEVQRMTDHWLALVNLGHVADRYPVQLSGGMKQRVAFARALALEPEAVLMDEPFGALDLLTRETLQEEVQRLREGSSRSFVLITHSVDEAVFMSDRVVLMSPSPGRIVEILDIDLPFPRTASVRLLPEYLKYRAHLSTRLRQELAS